MNHAPRVVLSALCNLRFTVLPANKMRPPSACHLDIERCQIQLTSQSVVLWMIELVVPPPRVDIMCIQNTGRTRQFREAMNGRKMPRNCVCMKGVMTNTTARVYSEATLMTTVRACLKKPRIRGTELRLSSDMVVVKKGRMES